MVTTDSFFDEMSTQSEVKAAIVRKYFGAWSKIMVPRANRIAYVDLFAGPGRYKDGKISTPLQVLQKAIADEKLSRKLITVFNDKDPDAAGNLKDAIASLDGAKNLTYSPKVFSTEIDTEVAAMFEDMSLVPALFFVDPWGYKGLSLRLINSVLKDWGCDCIFFFNYNRINMGIPNQNVRQHLIALFGETRALELATALGVCLSKSLATRTFVGCVEG